MKKYNLLIVDDEKATRDGLRMALEEEFETEIPDEDAEKITTVQQVITYINEHSKD